ncbi:hypothetical protein VPNG_05009 [Cytospora leucostoma]|uniref:Uncharacterized protein n=1 Tax=Cytospora leucostoma TaxID=1230097 RepID=A0A423X7A9_9PEZI|nr:hypothetical protein VPNG_05009 [Cytospora leucostoma]
MPELTRLRLTDNAGGMPSVVRADDGAVGAIIEVIGWIVRPVPGETGTKVGLGGEMYVVPEESRGPRPLEREMGEAMVGNSVLVTVVVVTRGLLGRLSMGSGHDEGKTEKLEDTGAGADRALKGGKVPTSVDIADDGLLIPGVEPPSMDTTAGGNSVSGFAGVAGVAACSVLTGPDGIKKEDVEDEAQSQAVKTVWVR